MSTPASTSVQAILNQPPSYQNVMTSSPTQNTLSGENTQGSTSWGMWLLVLGLCLTVVLIFLLCYYPITDSSCNYPKFKVGWDTHDRVRLNLPPWSDQMTLFKYRSKFGVKSITIFVTSSGCIYDLGVEFIDGKKSGRLVSAVDTDTSSLILVSDITSNSLYFSTQSGLMNMFGKGTEIKSDTMTRFDLPRVKGGSYEILEVSGGRFDRSVDSGIPFLVFELK